MAVLEGSRYQGVKLQRVKDARRGTVVALERSRFNFEAFEEKKTNRVHEVVFPESLQELAGLTYKDANKWWVLGFANRNLLYPFDLDPGDKLLIPPLLNIERL